MGKPREQPEQEEATPPLHQPAQHGHCGWSLERPRPEDRHWVQAGPDRCLQL